MVQCVLVPDSAGYSTEDNPEVISIQLDGGASRYRTDILNATSKVSVQWTTDLNGLYYLRTFYRANKGKPFTIRLLLDRNVLELYTAYFVPASMQLKEQLGQKCVVVANLEIVPIAQTSADAAFMNAYASAQPDVNFLANSSFEFDTDGDGLSDGWTAYSAGTVGTFTQLRVATPVVDHSATQRVRATTLGTTAADRAGIWQDVPLTGAVGLQGCLSASVYSTVLTNRFVIMFECRNSSGTVLATFATSPAAVTTASTWQRSSINGLIPANTVSVRCYIYETQANTSSNQLLFIDAAQFEVGVTTPSAYKYTV